MRLARINRKEGKRVWILLVVWFLLLAVTLSFLALLADEFNRNPQSQSFTSLSWSGYLVSNDFAVPPIQITGINGSWTVPEVNPSIGDTYSSAWVGIGGQNDKTLIQAGTEHNYVDGKADYYAWYELLPGFAVPIKEFILAPGDSFAVSITMNDSQSNQWRIQIRDYTRGQNFIKTVTYNSSRASGEWVMERPSINKSITSLANFGSITFSNCYIVVNNAVGNLSHFKYSQVKMANQADTALTSVTPVGTESSSFRVTYLSAN